jgi:hypothetical protein
MITLYTLYKPSNPQIISSTHYFNTNRLPHLHQWRESYLMEKLYYFVGFKELYLVNLFTADARAIRPAQLFHQDDVHLVVLDVPLCGSCGYLWKRLLKHRFVPNPQLPSKRIDLQLQYESLWKRSLLKTPLYINSQLPSKRVDPLLQNEYLWKRSLLKTPLYINYQLPSKRVDPLLQNEYLWKRSLLRTSLYINSQLLSKRVDPLLQYYYLWKPAEDTA